MFNYTLHRNTNKLGHIGISPSPSPQTIDSQASFSAQSDSASSSQSVSHGGNPELLLGLSYNATTGRLSVEIIKGSHFRNFALNRPPGKHTIPLTLTGSETHSQASLNHQE